MRVLRYYICVLCLVLFSGCVDIPDEPVLPTWDVQISVALTHTTHSIQDLVSDLAALPPEILDTLDLSNVVLTFEEMIPITGVGENGALDSTFTENFLANVWQARIFAEVENATPANLAVSLHLLDDVNAAVLSLPGNGGAVHLAGAPIDEAGKVGPSTTQSTFLDLNDPGITALESVEVLRYTIGISFPPGVSPVHVFTADSMSIRTWGTLWTTIDPE